jgi:hypothetical protein
MLGLLAGLHLMTDHQEENKNSAAYQALESRFDENTHGLEQDKYGLF